MTALLFVADKQLHKDGLGFIIDKVEKNQFRFPKFPSTQVFKDSFDDHGLAFGVDGFDRDCRSLEAGPENAA